MLWRGLELDLGYFAIMVAGAAALGGSVLWWVACDTTKQVSWSKAALVGAFGAGILPPLFSYFGTILCMLLRAAADPQSGPKNVASTTFGESVFEILSVVVVGFIYMSAMFYPTIIYMTVMGSIAGLICPSRISITNSTIAFLRNASPWLLSFAMVGIVFSVLGFLTAAMFFKDSQSRITAVAAGLSGVTASALVCGRRQTPSLGRTVLTGFLAGILVHPCFWILVYDPPGPGEYKNPEDLGIYGNSLGSIKAFGLATICLSIMAAFVCRRINNNWFTALKV
jgi:hypothetical protein